MENKFKTRVSYGKTENTESITQIKSISTSISILFSNSKQLPESTKT